MVGYLFGGNTGLSYQQLQDRRAAADALAKRIMGQQPKNTMEGIGALLTGAAAGIGRWQANKGLREGQEKQASLFDALLNKITGQTGSDTSGSGAVSGNLPTPGAGNEMAATDPSTAGMDYRNAIASIESDGSGGYGAIGPTHPKLGRPLGKYQIMEANIGPWSQEALGRAVTPEEFLNDPKIQDAIFNKKFSSYVQKYGPEGAAQAWFAGPGGVGKLDRKDSLGTSVGEYTRKFNKAIGGSAPAVAAIEQQAPGTGSVVPTGGVPDAQPPQQPVTPLAGDQPGTTDGPRVLNDLGRLGSAWSPADFDYDYANLQRELFFMNRAISGERYDRQNRPPLGPPPTPTPDLSQRPNTPAGPTPPTASASTGQPPTLTDMGRLGDPLPPAPTPPDVAISRGPRLPPMPSAAVSRGARLPQQDAAYAPAPQMPADSGQPQPGGNIPPAPAQPPAPVPPPAASIPPQPAAAPQQPQAPQRAAPNEVAQNGPMTMPTFEPYRIDPDIVRFLASPFADEGQKQALRMVVQQQMDQHNQQQQQKIWQARQDYDTYQRRSDPAYQANLDQTRAETDRMKNGPRPITADERRAWGIPDTDTRPYAMTPGEGPKLIGSGGQTINVGSQIDARIEGAKRIGLTPDDPRYMGYLATGDLPKENQQNLTAVDKKAIQDADDMVIANQSALDALGQASALSDDANSGWFAGTRAALGNNLPDWAVWDRISSPKSSQATTDMDNAIIGQAVTQLKTIFGGSPTEGERAILLELQGSSSMPKEVRAKVFDRAKTLAEKRLKFNQDRANDLRGGTYYKAGRAPAASTGPNVDDLLKKYGGQ